MDRRPSRSTSVKELGPEPITYIKKNPPSLVVLGCPSAKGGFGPPTFAQHPVKGSVPEPITYIKRTLHLWKVLLSGAGGFGPPTFAQHSCQGARSRTYNLYKRTLHLWKVLLSAAGGFGPPTSVPELCALSRLSHAPQDWYYTISGFSGKPKNVQKMFKKCSNTSRLINYLNANSEGNLLQEGRQNPYFFILRN